MDAGNGSCLPQRACNPACTKASDCQANEACINAVCGQAPATSVSYSACALDADCPRGDYCKLGACRHDCLADRDCTGGTVCSLRGKCLAEQVITQPDVPTPPSKGVPQVSADTLTFDDATNSQTVTLSNAGGEPFEFRVLSSSPAFTVVPFEGRVSGQAVLLTVTIDRATLAGQSTGFLTVNTSAGTKRIVLKFTETLAGTWAGAFEVTNPVVLGRHTALLTFTGTNTFQGAVIGDESPVWPANAAISGQVATSGDITLSFSLDAPRGSAANPTVPNALTRSVELKVRRTGPSTLSGTYTETINGLVGTGVVIGGNVALQRVGIERTVAALPAPAPAAPVDDPFFDANGATRQPYQTCTSCPTGTCGASAVANGDSFFNFAPSGIRLSMQFYYEFAPSSATPYQADKCVAPVGADVTFCAARRTYDLLYLRCAQYWYAKALRAGDSSAAPKFLDTLKVASDAALYEGNAAVAAANDDFVDPLASLGTTENTFALGVTRLTTGLYSTAATPIAFVDPAIATYLSRMSAADLANGLNTTADPIVLAATGPGEQLRRGLINIAAQLFAFDQQAFVMRKRNAQVVASQKLKEGLVTGYLELAALSPALGTSPTTWARELAAIRAQWRSLSVDLKDVADGKNALGYVDGYVPFFWNKDNPGATNYLQIKSTADSNAVQWATSYTLAQMNIRAFETSTTAMQAELNSQMVTIKAQYTDICGAASTSVDDCGSDYGTTNASLVAQAKLEIIGAQKRIDMVIQAGKNIVDEITIEQSRAAAVAGVHENNALLIRSTGEKVKAIDYAIGQINRQQHVVDIAASTAIAAAGSASTSFGTASAVQVGVGIAHALISNINDINKLAKEQDKEDLQTNQSATIEFSYSQTELINSAALIKTKLLQLTSLSLEQDVALNGLAQAVGRLYAHYEKADQLLEANQRAASLLRNQGLQAIHYRIYANHLGEVAARDGRLALQWAFLATRALEYQLNMSIDQSAMWQARAPVELTSYLNGLVNIAGTGGSAQPRTDVISVRNQLLGFTAPIKDAATGAVVNPRERFRRFVMSPQNRDADGNFHMQFSTQSVDNPLFSTLFASDRIRGIRINLVGDNLGAGLISAQVQLVHGGTSYLRSRMRDSTGVAPLVPFDVSGKANQPSLAIVQAGINAPNFMGLPENIEFQERAVLASPWQLIIDQTPATPANAALNLAGLDDIEIQFTHDAYTIQ